MSDYYNEISKDIAKLFYEAAGITTVHFKIPFAPKNKDYFCSHCIYKHRHITGGCSIGEIEELMYGADGYEYEVTCE